jgi:hypothetical protein
MSEWIDFLMYALQLMLFLVFLPRQSRQFALPALVERNPDWFAQHPEVAARLERSRWFMITCYAWAAVSIAVLLGVTLELFGAPLGAAAPKWEVLKDWHATFLIMGVLGWFVCGVLWVSWLSRCVPLAETRRAVLKPRVVGDYLSQPWRIAVEALTALHLGAWVVVGALGLAGGLKYWAAFAFVLAMTVLFAGIAFATPRRRPGFPDRLFGDQLRRVELKAAYVLRLTPIITGGMVISEQAFGLDPDRVGHVLLVSTINALLLLYLSLRPVVPPREAFAAEPRLTA